MAGRGKVPILREWHEPMKNAKNKPDDELRPEHDLKKLTDGVRGKHYNRFCAGNNLALLAPDVRAAFPTDDAVNQALRSIMQDPAPSGGTSNG
jgi:hypothetical protein